MALILYDPLFDIVNANGAPIAGAKAYFYETGTTTPATVYADNDLTTPLTNPVIANSAGRFVPIFLDPATSYRLVAKDANDVPISNGDVDPLNPTGTVGTASLQNGAVTGPKLADGAVTTAKVGDGQLTLPKFADVVGPTILGLVSGTGAPEAITSAHQFHVLLDMVGEVFQSIRATPPSASLKCNGSTIGSAGSGATALASADAAELFSYLWDLNATDYPVYTSGGGASTRGASAAEDFAANKRIKLPEMRAEFPRGLDDGRGVDTGRVIGSSQTEMVGPHSHTIGTTVTHSNGGQNALDPTTGTGTSTANNSGTENRPRNVAWPFYIRY